MKKTVLKNYAKLIAKTGVNVKSGQDVIIRAELDQPEFVAYVAEECYRAGARNVRVEWSHQPVSRLNAIYQSEDTLAEVAPWAGRKTARPVALSSRRHLSGIGGSRRHERRGRAQSEQRLHAPLSQDQTLPRRDGK